MNTSDQIQRDSAGWIFFVKTSFVCAMLAAFVGIYCMPSDLWIKGYMAMSALYLVGSSFTLAKALRDQHESDKLINKIAQAKTEKMLKEFDQP